MGEETEGPEEMEEKEFAENNKCKIDSKEEGVKVTDQQKLALENGGAVPIK